MHQSAYNKILDLLRRQLQDGLSEPELQELQDWADSDPLNQALIKRISDPVQLQQAVQEYYMARENIFQKIQTQVPVLQSAETTPVVPMKTMPFGWIKYAVAVIIILGLGLYLWNTQENGTGKKGNGSETPLAANDALPGSSRATLTLADGSLIHLDSASNGTLATQGNAEVIKKGGEIIYDDHLSPLPSPVSYNTMSTPRGGQYQLTLPDGSRVWLNAASSITYPTAFTGRERRVSVTGEAYFEVAKDKTKPFKVSILSMGGEEPRSGSGVGPGQSEAFEIVVLGTHFNINTYNEEPTMNTTLLEGRVQIKAVHTALLLNPGQQGQFNRNQGKLSLAVHADVDQVMAWKNGVFNFNEVKLEEAMQQLSRWYDVDVVYEGKVPDKTFIGKMGRDLTLSQVLKGLAVMGVKYRINNKQLIVTQ